MTRQVLAQSFLRPCPVVWPGGIVAVVRFTVKAGLLLSMELKTRSPSPELVIVKVLVALLSTSTLPIEMSVSDNAISGSSPIFLLKTATASSNCPTT